MNTWTQRGELRFLYLLLAFAVTVALLVVLPPHSGADAAFDGLTPMNVSDGNTDAEGGVDWELPPGTFELVSEPDQEILVDQHSNFVVKDLNPPGNGPNSFGDICEGSDQSIAKGDITTPQIIVDT